MGQDLYKGESAMMMLIDLKNQLEFESEVLLTQYKGTQNIKAHDVGRILKTIADSLPSNID
jgi:hypothetical protein